MKEKLLIFKDKNFNLERSISIIILTSLISGFIGFLIETVIYSIRKGHLVNRGYTYGPWIPLYVFGALIILIFLYKYKDKPLKFFIMSTFTTGVLELGTGFILDKVFNKKPWTYNHKKWNFLNIGGYVCLRSALMFGIGSVLLVYILVPLVIKLTGLFNQRKVAILSYILLFIFFMDIVLHTVFK